MLNPNMFMKPSLPNINKKIEIDKLSGYFCINMKESRELDGMSRSRCL